MRTEYGNRPCPYEAPSMKDRVDRDRLARFLNQRLKTGIDASLFFQEYDRWYHLTTDSGAARRQLTQEELHPKKGRPSKSGIENI